MFRNNDMAEKKEYLDSVADDRKIYRKKGWYYYRNFEKYMRSLIPENVSVLEIGCDTGELLASLKPRRGLGVNVSPRMVSLAKNKFPHLEFSEGTLESLEITETFDYVLLGGVIGYTKDIQAALQKLQRVCRPDTRIIIVYYNYLWEPLIKFAEIIKLRMKRPGYHWLSLEDIKNLIYLAGFETVKEKYHFLIPLYIPLVSTLCNKFLVSLPFFRKLALSQILVAKPERIRKKSENVSCSVIVPCRNEKGNIESAVKRLPSLGSHTEIIFVEGHSQDGTFAECERVKHAYPQRDISCFIQDGKGKADAVRKGFSEAKGDILMILDADLTVPPEDLSKFFEVISSGKGEFINGSRLVYKMEKNAMRFLNVLGNKFFSTAFTFLLEQYIKDTLCGTKVLWRQDYKKIVMGRGYFGDFDPFGDFDLLFGAARLNLKIIEIPVHYQDRTYGSTQISRFRHGLLLLRMTVFAMRKFKFI